MALFADPALHVSQADPAKRIISGQWSPSRLITPLCG